MRTLLVAIAMVLAPVILHADGSWKLDWDYSHSNATQKLPVLDLGSAPPDGLYRVKIENNEFRARVYGMENTGPGIVLLHGFPGSSISWEPLAIAAAESGYRVIAYDQRGYSPGARPEGKRKYAVDYFLEDLRQIAAEAGFESYHLVGHDVGCVVGWTAAMVFETRLKSLSCLSIPNPDVLELRNYVKLLSIPLIPEAVLRMGQSKKFRAMLPEGRSLLEDEEYRQIFTEPGSLTATLNFYRAIYISRKMLKERFSKKVAVPTLFLYGTGEGWVNDEVLSKQSAAMAPGTLLRVREIENAGTKGHFLMENQPEIVIQEILGHIQSH